MYDTYNDFKKINFPSNRLQVKSARNNKVFVAEPHSGIITVFDSEGTQIRSFGGITKANEDGRFTNGNNGYAISHLIIDSEQNIYVSDIGRNRIQKFNPEGEFITSFNCFSNMDRHTINLAIDNENYLYVTNLDTGVIKKFDKEGKFQCDIDAPACDDTHLFITIDIEEDYEEELRHEEESLSVSKFLDTIMKYFEPTLRLLHFNYK
ncbi:MAG: hypothetical protein A2X42_09005 [Candidatus Margulisbacteria bacterium GWF2_38_17]|nr:MAG: hypothetical protein A2X42_09005 [Candidatus Margulisbacteria bacterium GWF2_38_17]